VLLLLLLLSTKYYYPRNLHLFEKIVKK